MSFKSDDSEYSKFLNSPVEGVTTRAIVVSNKDSMFSGRVKVWIPALHGVFNDTDDVDIEESVEMPPLPKGAKYPGNWQDPAVQDMLPWAKCLGHNWGPRKNENGAISLSGAFSIPKVGTEVYVAFENDDPNMPIILGSIFHSSEYTYAKYRPLELFPGVEVVTSSLDYNRFTPDGNLAQQDTDDYTSKAAYTYSIRAENDSMLYLCDYPGESAIMLSGLIKLSDKDTLIGDKALAVKKAYPGFPTTASAAFAKRILLSDDSIALADPNIEYKPPFEQLSVSPEVKTTLPQSIAPEEKAATNTEPIKIVKQWPVKPPVGRAVPQFPNGYPNGNFGAPRPTYKNKEKRHVGVDIVAAKDNSTILVAPIDMIPIKYNPHSYSAGVQLFCKAADGTGHGFFHLASVFPTIISLIQSHPGTMIKAGTPMGYCGNTGAASQGAHLHWEIFKGAGSAKTGDAFMAIRSAAVNAGTSQFYNPVSWMGSAASESTIIQGTPEQMRSWIDHQTMYANTDDVNYTKPIGLEISTVPGQETVFLRHPSGAFMGFDCDGNYQMFTPGDANHRVNRSWNLDVLGGILESCYAKFSRIKTVARVWAKIFSNMKDKKDADDTYPDFFKRTQKYRKIDMLTSLRSTLGNAYYVNKEDGASPITNAYSDICKGIATPPNTTKKDIGCTEYDKLISKAYSKYITGDMTRIFPDWKWFKAQMLLESNGVKDARGGGSIGLFQITSIAIEDIKKYTPTEGQFAEYVDPEKNIDIAFQLARKNYYYIQKAVGTYCSRVAGAKSFSELSAEDIRNLCFFTYNVGSGEMANRINSLFETTLTYPAVEAVYKAVHVNNPNTVIHLQYVPTICWLRNQL